MSSLFDPSCLWITLLVPSKGPSSPDIHSCWYIYIDTHTHTHVHICPQGSVWWGLSTRTSACLSFCLSKSNERGGGQERQREITRRAYYIPSNLMAAVVCPVLTRNEFGPQYSSLFPISRWLTAWWWELMKGSLPKLLGYQFKRLKHYNLNLNSHLERLPGIQYNLQNQLVFTMWQISSSKEEKTINSF